jgi:hypothetical protein
MNGSLFAGCRIVIASLFLCLLAPGGARGGEGFSTAPFRDGEVLRYRVRYGPIRLGTLVLSQEAADSMGGTKSIVRMTAEAAPGLPILKARWSNRSLLVPSYPSLREFDYISALEDGTHVHCRYDGVGRQVVIVEERAGAAAREVRRSVDGPVYDAGGVVMMIRCMSGSGRKVDLPTLVVEDFRATALDFTPRLETVEVPAFHAPVRAVRFDGRAEWVLPTAAGMTGEFHGWLTPDEAAIPVKATVRIFLGSVTLELESFERPASDRAP